MHRDSIRYTQFGYTHSLCWDALTLVLTSNTWRRQTHTKNTHTQQPVQTKRNSAAVVDAAAAAATHFRCKISASTGTRRCALTECTQSAIHFRHTIPKKNTHARPTASKSMPHFHCIARCCSLFVGHSRVIVVVVVGVVVVGSFGSMDVGCLRSVHCVSRVCALGAQNQRETMHTYDNVALNRCHCCAQQISTLSTFWPGISAGKLEVVYVMLSA